MLRADLFAFSALDAVVGVFEAVLGYQPFCLIFSHCGFAVERQVVHSCERAGNADLHGTDFGAVVAGGAGDQGDFL